MAIFAYGPIYVKEPIHHGGIYNIALSAVNKKSLLHLPLQYQGRLTLLRAADMFIIEEGGRKKGTAE
jgi:hypothetical protein